MKAKFEVVKISNKKMVFKSNHVTLNLLLTLKNKELEYLIQSNFYKRSYKFVSKSANRKLGMKILSIILNKLNATNDNVISI